MASENEPAKLLLPYLQRADELQKHEPLVAYYCRLYAMERGLRIPQNDRTKTTNSLLISLMKQLEKDKKSLNLGPDDNLHLEGFALSVFAKADKQDRAGRADLNTAKTFYAASIFFEILNQFGVPQPDIEQKQKYAAWKAADIRKALKEGRKPIPGPPGGGDDLSIPSSTPSGAYDLGPSNPAVTSPGNEFDPSSQFLDKVDHQPSTTFPSSPEFHDNDSNQNSKDIPPPQFHENVGHQHSEEIPPSLSSYPSASYSSHDIHPPTLTNRSENPAYSHSYHQSYPQEPQQHMPHNYPSHEPPPPYSYPNFQSYPSFTESSLPSSVSHYPSYYQGSPHSPSPTNYPSTSQYITGSRNGTVPETVPAAPAPAPAQRYEYDCNYQPPPEKIAEAHKAARFAVGALAFDDVSVAVDYLRKSLELLTSPSTAQ